MEQDSRRSASPSQRSVPWNYLAAFYGEGEVTEARWVGDDLEVTTELGTDVWPEGDLQAVLEAMTRIATAVRADPLAARYEPDEMGGT
jgi:hypothetical protein